MIGDRISTLQKLLCIPGDQTIFRAIYHGGPYQAMGTGRAVLAAKKSPFEPFAVINAATTERSLRKVHDYLVQDHLQDGPMHGICMAGFRLGNTLK